MTACLEDETVAAWTAGALPADERERAIEHVASCDACRALVAHVFADAGSTDRVGRYEIRGSLGAGGMGVVLRAFDPVLGREVAIKMIHAALVEPAHRERMLREAQAIAKISHRNVVVVHDFGEVGDEVFVAMELVAGTMLHRWLQTGPSRAARIAAVLDIGRGVAAVHAAGLLHRDIKPDNIVVRDDGSPVLVDFGLARAGAALGTGSGFAGTPDYVAPEVVAGGVATAASDQYQWWTIVREALGELPRSVARGRDPDPARRFASMTDAVAALERALRRPRWPWLAVPVVAVVAVVALRGGDATCERALPDGWSPLVRVQVALGVVGSALDPARALVALDARAETTADLRVQACRAPAEWTRRLACVEDTWEKTRRAVVKLAGGGVENVRDALDDLALVLPADRCGRASLPALPEPLDPAGTARYHALSEQLGNIETDRRRKPAERTAALRALADEIARLHYAPLDARWHWSLAHTLADGRDHAAAAREFDLAAQAGLAAGEDQLYVRAILLELNALPPAASAERVAQLEEQAAAGARRLDNPMIDAQLAGGRANLWQDRGDNAKARKLYEEADRLYLAASLGPEVLHVRTLENLGAICLETGDFDAADRYLDRAVTLARERWTENGPHYWEARGARATSLVFRGQLARAEPELRAVAEGLARTHTDSDQIGMFRTYLCAAQLGQNKNADARTECANAVAAVRAAVGDTSPSLVFPLALSGQVELHDHAPAAAIPLLRRAVELARANHLRPVEVGMSEAYLAIALHETSALAEARKLAVEVAPTLRMPELDEAHKAFAKVFPDLK
jgi:tetratricopeptide (TPR) repeat protein